jgi:mRNA-degrading endonuclease toxin of MazEF toxin-antitoxin module
MTPTPGEIWIADLADEIRRRVLVISDPRFHQLAGRALVVPIIDPPSVPFPWVVDLGDGDHGGVHLLRSVAVDRLLNCDRVISEPIMRSVRSVVEHLLS